MLNGVRLASKAGQLRADDTSLHFFAHDPDGGQVRLVSPTIDADGRLSEWPDGFFDQFDIALSELL